jgi:adenylate kinase
VDTYTEEDLERIAAAVGKAAADVKARKKDFENAAVRAQPHRLVVFDGHLVIDTDRDLVEIPLEVIARLRPSLMVHVEDDAEKIAVRRSQDRDRVRPVRSVEILEKHQRLSRRLWEAYASALDTEMLVCGPDDVERFRILIKLSDQSAPYLLRLGDAGLQHYDVDG